jgi:hypothetical protein
LSIFWTEFRFFIFLADLFERDRRRPSSAFLMPSAAHQGDEFAGELLVERALALIRDDLAGRQIGDFTGIDNYIGFEVENALELTERDIEQVADTAGQALKNHTCEQGLASSICPRRSGARGRG